MSGDTSTAGQPGATSAHGDACPVGPALVTRLAQQDVRSLTDAELLDRTTDLRRAQSWLAALEQDSLVELARRPARVEQPGDDAEVVRVGYAEPGVPARWTLCDEFAAVTSSTARSVQHRLDLALGLVGLPLTREALAAGRLDLARARVVVEGTRCLDEKQRRRLDERFAARAEPMTPTRLKRHLARAVLATGPEAAEVRARQACDQRRVVVTPVADGMAELWALLPAVDAIRIREVLTAGARRIRHDAARQAAAAGANDNDESQVEERTLDQLRADLLCDLFRDAAHHGRLPPVCLSEQESRSRSTSTPAPCSGWTPPPACSPPTAR